MKKQFFRVKQLADQTFNKAGKTNALSDDLQDADRKAEFIKNACQTITKKVSACLLLGSAVGDVSVSFKDRKEKAMKKSPEHALSTSLRECCKSYEDDSPLRNCLEECASTEQALLDDNLERDVLVENEVIAHLQALLDNEIPSISKHKRNVSKFCLDMDSAKARYSQASKHSGNTPAGSAKAEQVKEELEECETKLEQSRDALACEMFHLIVREADLCRYLMDFYKYRKTYFENAIKHLDGLIPILEGIAGDSSVRKVYGTRLDDHLRVTERKIAYPIELCVCALLELGMNEEGLFRLAGGAGKVKRMKLSLDAGCMTLATALTYCDPHVIAGCLKSYLRDLPEPLLTFDLYEEWLDAVRGQANEPERLNKLKAVLDRLPVAHFENLRYLVRFFHRLSKNQETNKMTPQNLAIVLAPNLIWKGYDNSGICLNALNDTALYSRIVELLVSCCDWFFPGDSTDKEFFYVTLVPVPVMNGEPDGIDNRGFDPRSPDGMKRSQSVNSLTDDPPGSPKPITRKKNKPVAPNPPVDKQTRPLASSTVNSVATLPRQAKVKPIHSKATETEDNANLPSGELKPENEVETKISPKVEKKVKATVATNTDPQPVAEIRQDLKVAKEKWLLGGKPAIPERPVIPERPAALKPTVKNLRNTFNALDAGKNYENVSVSSSENLSGDERTLQRTQVYSIEKQQIAIIKVNEKKRDRSREKKSKEKEKDPSDCVPDNVDGGEIKDGVADEAEDIENSVSAVEPVVTDNEVVAADNEQEEPLKRKHSVGESKRPVSLSGFSEKPERPPKPDHITSPSHCRTLSDGQIIDKPSLFPQQRRDVNANEGGKSVKHPSTSPPPPPVPNKPRAQSQSESTDF